MAPDANGSVPAYTRRALGTLIGLALVVLALDQGTKHLAVAELTDRDPVRLLGGAVYLVLTRNSGAAFSLARDHTYVFPVISLGVAGWIGWMALRVRSVPWAISLGLVLGGALGNLVDRIFRWPKPFVGHVVDFISVFDDNGQVWPIFNVADMALVTGVSLAILLELTGRRRDGTRAVGAGRSADVLAAEPGTDARDPASAGVPDRDERSDSRS